jgi:hypothetical protein
MYALRADFSLSGTQAIASTLSQDFDLSSTGQAVLLFSRLEKVQQTDCTAAGLAQTGALNVILFFTDGRPTAVTENLPVIGNCNNRNPSGGVITPGYNCSGVATSILGLYKQDATAQPMAQDRTPITSPSGCHSSTYQDVANAALLKYWGNSLNATAYRTADFGHRAQRHAAAECGELFHQCRRRCGAVNPPRRSRRAERQPHAAGCDEL